MIKRINAVFAAVCCMMSMAGGMMSETMQVGAAYQAGSYEVDTHSVYVRTEPGDGIEGYAADGTVFDVTAVDGRWGYTSAISGTSGKTISGWICLDNCVEAGASTGSGTSASSGNSAVSASNQVKVTAAVSVTFRSGPDSKYDTIGWIPRDTVLTVKESFGKWVKVDYNGKTGWISTKYAERTGGQTPSANVSVKRENNTGIHLNFDASFAYAKKYWNLANGEYNYYPGFNCCNYVSQILVAGGLPTTEKFCNGSYPFIRIAEFRPYICNTYGIEYIDNPIKADIETGDMLLTNDNKHIMFCTLKSDSTGRIYASGNTYNRDSIVLTMNDICGVIKTSEFFK